ncbi:MAG: hypothetical protein E7539_00780 [Ruminococcaceae bacterium]|nr:hypothetical protein [Oscillospiraceae bacterium]
MSGASKIVKTLLVSLLAVFLLVFVGYQIYSAVYSPYHTETVSELTHENKIELNGMFLRSEENVTAAHKGYIVHYLYSDGQKVGAGGTVAELYASESDVVNYEKIKELKNLLSLLEESQDQSSVLVTNADQINTQINNKIKEYSQAVYNNDADAIERCKNDLQVLLNRRNIITEKETDFNDYISQVKKEIKTLEGKIKNALKSVYAQKNGNFVISADGFEKTAQYSKLSSLSAAEIEKFINDEAPQSVADNTIGKLITDFDWHYVFMLPIDDSEYHKKIKAGTSLKIRFPDISEKPVNVIVSSVALSEEEGKMAVFVKSNQMTGKFCSARREKAELIFSSVKGYRVPKSAIRIVDGEQGVYVVIGQQMMFRKVDVIFEGNDYVVCSAANGSGTLKPFDDVIVKGTDLYDGKTI